MAPRTGEAPAISMERQAPTISPWLPRFQYAHVRSALAPTLTPAPADVPKSESRNWAVVAHEVGATPCVRTRTEPGGVHRLLPSGDVELTRTILTSEYDDVGIMNYCGPGTRPCPLLDIRGAAGVRAGAGGGRDPVGRALPARRSRRCRPSPIYRCCRSAKGAMYEAVHVGGGPR